MAYACAQAVEKRQTRKASDAFTSMIDGNSDLFTDPRSLTHSPAFSTFEAAYDLSNYNGTLTDPRDSDLPNPNDPQSLIDRPYGWNERFHDPPLF